MAKVLLSGIIALVFGFFSFTTFPFFHDMYDAIDITGMLPIVGFMVKAMPYVLLFGIVYGIVLILTRQSQE